MGQQAQSVLRGVKVSVGLHPIEVSPTGASGTAHTLSLDTVVSITSARSGGISQDDSFDYHEKLRPSNGRQ
jgi:hypothetical protein